MENQEQNNIITKPLNQNKMNTAVEWLFENLNITGGSEDLKAFEQAKQMEKEQIERAYQQGGIDAQNNNIQ